MKVLVGGLIRTMADGAPVAEALAHDRGRIVAVGDRAGVLAAAGARPEVIDLRGKTVVPGFIDAHHHFIIKLLLEAAADCRPEVAPSVAAIGASVAAAAARTPGSGWVVGYGHDELRVDDRRHPTCHDLDAAVPDRPVVLIHYTYHQAVVNSRALTLLGIDRRTPDPSGGIIVRDRRGRATGQLIETAMEHAEREARLALLAASRDGADLVGRLPALEDALFATGITRLVDPVVPPECLRLYRRAHTEGRLRIPVVVMPVYPGGHIHSPPDWAKHGVTGDGRDELRIGPVKMIFDGGHACAMCLSFTEGLSTLLRSIATAARRRSLSPLRAMNGHRRIDLRNRRVHQGLRFYAKEAANAAVRDATGRGYAVAIHAIGNEAVDAALDAIEASRKIHRDDRPPRIEHAEIMTRDQARRMGDLGVTAVVQPTFVQMAESLPSLPPALRVIPLRSLLDGGVILAGSSDHPVVDFDPLLALRCAVRRRDRPDMEPVQPEEALTAAEVLRMYTRDAARAAGCGDVTGTLEAGKRADLAVLSADPCDPRGELDHIHVVETVLGGETVYRRRDGARAG